MWNVQPNWKKCAMWNQIVRFRVVMCILHVCLLFIPMDANYGNFTCGNNDKIQLRIYRSIEHKEAKLNKFKCDESLPIIAGMFWLTDIRILPLACTKKLEKFGYDSLWTDLSNVGDTYIRNDVSVMEVRDNVEHTVLETATSYTLGYSIITPPIDNFEARFICMAPVTSKRSSLYVECLTDNDQLVAYKIRREIYQSEVSNSICNEQNGEWVSNFDDISPNSRTELQDGNVTAVWVELQQDEAVEDIIMKFSDCTEPKNGNILYNNSGTCRQFHTKNLKTKAEENQPYVAIMNKQGSPVFANPRLYLPIDMVCKVKPTTTTPPPPTTTTKTTTEKPTTLSATQKSSSKRRFHTHGPNPPVEALPSFTEANMNKLWPVIIAIGVCGVIIGASILGMVLYKRHNNRASVIGEDLNEMAPAIETTIQGKSNKVSFENVAKNKVSAGNAGEGSSSGPPAAVSLKNVGSLDIAKSRTNYTRQKSYQWK